MTAAVAMLRAVNLPGHQRIDMATLKKVCLAMGFEEVQSYIASGNLVFRADRGDAASLAHRLEDGIEASFGFRPAVVVRTAAELRKVIAANPFAGRPGIEPSRLLVVFMAGTPARKALEQVLALPCAPEEIRSHGCELYIYYPDGMARPKIPLARLEKTLQCSSTGRNWNTVNKLMAMVEALETGDRTVL